MTEKQTWSEWFGIDGESKRAKAEAKQHELDEKHERAVQELRQLFLETEEGRLCGQQLAKGAQQLAPAPPASLRCRSSNAEPPGTPSSACLTLHAAWVLLHPPWSWRHSPMQDARCQPNGKYRHERMFDHATHQVASSVPTARQRSWFPTHICGAGWWRVTGTCR
jgi:hypothetical protein